MNKQENVGYIEIQKERMYFEGTHYLYIMVDKEFKIGDFDEGAYDYAYSLSNKGINIIEIKSVKKFPKELFVMCEAIKKVKPSIHFNNYKLIINSSLGKDRIEEEVREWIREETQTSKMFTHITKLSKVIKKRIPISKEKFLKTLKEVKPNSSHE